jgi:hypothetical protein
VVVAALLLVAMVAGMTVLGGHREDLYPDEWDARIEPLAKFVEHERGMLFEHPVYVDFLDKDAFDSDMTDSALPTDDEREELDRYAGLFRAFGLISGEIDLFDTSNELLSDGVAAYYSYETKRITVNGDDLDTATKVTLVHELTHALQDQYFDLGSIEAGLDDTTVETFTAVVEGDATRIENLYYYDLTDDEKDEVAESYEVDSEEADYGRFPRVIVADFGAPYALGEPFVRILAAADGPDAIDDAITSPPPSMEQVLDPFARLDADVPQGVAEPELADGEDEFERGTLGAFFLYLVLNERIDPMAALAAADGWAGDAYVAFTRDGATCVRAEIAAESPEALDRLDDAMAVWAQTMPAGSTSYAVAETITLESCDPGADATIPPPVTPELDPLVVPTTRAEIAAGALEDGLTVEETRCVVEHFFGGLTVAQITAEDDRYANDLDALRAETAAACGLG